MTLPAGTQLGPYEVLGSLGAGGMGEVYRARDTRLGRDVALKVLPREVALDSGRLRRFEQEARSASALNHPNIVTIYEIGTADSVSYIAMERVEGKTLRELLFSGPLAVNRLLQIATQIADGLARAHEAGIVHRDLKPENVMVTKDGLVKILDFGLAKAMVSVGGDETSSPTETGTTPGVVLGTVGYMSPEQASGEPLDFRSDQFSFGSILYEMATGKRAFHRATAAQTLTAIIQDEPEPIGSLRAQAPAPFRWMVQRCLSKDPEGRYASTKDLARELVVVRDHLSEAVPSDAETAIPRSRFRRSLGPLLLAVPLMALAAGLFLGKSIGKEAPSSPSFQRLTFRRGAMGNARFTPDGQSVVYSATWEGEKRHIYMTRPGNPESRIFYPEADLYALSSLGEVAIMLGPYTRPILARVPLAGGAAREVAENVAWANADWAPDGKDLAVIRSVGARNRLEYPIGKTLFETSESIGRPRFSPSGEEIAFFRWSGSPSLLVIGTDGRELRTILSMAWAGMHGVPVWTPDGREVWFTAAEPGRFHALYAADRSGKPRLVMRMPGSLELYDIFRDGRVLVGRIAEQSFLMGLAPGEEKERELSWFDWSLPCDLSADGKMLVFTEIFEGGGPFGAVYLRKTDGSPAVRLGEGEGLSLSPDGKWVIAVVAPGGKAPPRLTLLPTGPGVTQTLEIGRFEGFGGADWLPDGRRILFSAKEAGRRVRVYVHDIAGGKPRATTPEGITLRRFGNAISPDGKSFVAYRESGQPTIHPEQAGGPSLYPTEGGGQPRPIPGMTGGDTQIQWAADGRAIYVYRRSMPVRAKVWLLDVDTGEKKLWKEIRPADTSISSIRDVVVSPDGKSYAYRSSRSVSELYLVEGLR